MKAIGVDFGLKKIGIAYSEGKLAEPVKVLRGKSLEDLIAKTINEINRLEGSLVVVGISERESEQKAREFGKEIESRLGIEVRFEDETRSTKDAQQFAIAAGIGRKKRKDMEDAYAAAIILQNFLDAH